MKIEVSNGELFDRITILQIKLKKIKDLDKLIAVKDELAELKELGRFISTKHDFYNLVEELRVTNEMLWNIEDEIRYKDSQKEFDEDFIALAQQVYQFNDYRASVKAEINELTSSDLVEVKQYNPYPARFWPKEKKQ